MLEQTGDNTGNKLRSTHHDHCDREVGSQLVVRPGLRRAVRVFVDAASVDEVGPGLVLRHRARVDPEELLKVVLDSLRPLLEVHFHLLTCTQQRKVLQLFSPVRT